MTSYIFRIYRLRAKFRNSVLEIFVSHHSIQFLDLLCFLPTAETDIYTVHIYVWIPLFFRTDCSASWTFYVLLILLYEMSSLSFDQMCKIFVYWTIWLVCVCEDYMLLSHTWRVSGAKTKALNLLMEMQLQQRPRLLFLWLRYFDERTWTDVLIKKKLLSLCVSYLWLDIWNLNIFGVWASQQLNSLYVTKIQQTIRMYLFLYLLKHRYLFFFIYLFYFPSLDLKGLAFRFDITEKKSPNGWRFLLKTKK